jgi:hypothetical protein
VDGFVNFYFHWLRPLGGWLLVLLLAALPTLWLFSDSARRQLPARLWRLGAALAFLLFVPTMIVVINAELHPEIAINPRRPDAQLSAALGLVMLALVWGIIGSYILIYWGMKGSEIGRGVYRQGQTDPYLTNAQRSALGGQPINDAALFPQRSYANAVLIEATKKTPYPLLKGQTRLGRSRDNDVILNQDSSVSRRHGMIWETSGAFVLHNYSLRNPIRYNGQPMAQGQTWILRHGDTLQLGQTRLIFSLKVSSAA